MKFYKMHGLGNDFMVIDGVRQTVSLSSSQIATLARRDIGVGFDQCLLVEPARDADSDFFYRIFNADGSEVAQCGNGARCLGRFIEQQGLSQKRNLRLSTHTTRMEVQLEADKQVSVFFAAPQFDPAAIPLLAKTQQDRYALPIQDGQTLWVHALSVGNPHAVSVVEQLESLDLQRIGPTIGSHKLFPQQCNAGFMQILSDTRLALRVYERGAGETQACGSGAVAAAVVARRFYQMGERIEVQLAGGSLWVHWQGPGERIQLTGPAEFVYQGELMTCV